MNTSLTSSDWESWHLATLGEMQGLYQSLTHPNTARTQEICNAFTPIVDSAAGASAWQGIYNVSPPSYYVSGPSHYWRGILISDWFGLVYTDLNVGNVGSYMLDSISRTLTGAWIVAEGNNAPAPPVPVPGAIWLLGSGLAAMAGLRKKMRK